MCEQVKETAWVHMVVKTPVHWSLTAYTPIGSGYVTQNKIC